MTEVAAVWPHVGAILCGGKGSRMGRPKAGIVGRDGRTMIEHVHEALAQVCSSVVLVGQDPGIPPALAALPRIPDRIADCGPLAGVEALLGSGFDSEYLIAPCDLCCVVADLFRLLVQPEVLAPAVLVADGDQHLEPLICRYPAASHSQVLDAIRRGRLSMRELAICTGARPIQVPPELVFALLNVNTAADLARGRGDDPEPGQGARTGSRMGC